MDAALFTKMLSDKNVLDLRKLGYKFPQADIKEFTELLKNGFYYSLPLKDFSGQNIVYLSSIAQVRLSAAKVLLTPQNSTQLYGVKAMEEEIVSTFTIEQVDFTRDSVRKILSGLAPTDESESRIFGMKKGLEFISDPTNQISEETIYQLYEMAIGAYLSEEDRLLPGHFYRHDSVYVVGAKVEHTGLPWQALPERMGELVAFIREDSEINDLLKAALIHFYIAYLHPYFDGNGRMARLMHLWYLVQQGYSSALFVPLSEYINKSRKGYYDAYTLAEENATIRGVVDATPFLAYFIENVYHISVLGFGKKSSHLGIACCSLNEGEAPDIPCQPCKLLGVLGFGIFRHRPQLFQIHIRRINGASKPVQLVYAFLGGDLTESPEPFGAVGIEVLQRNFHLIRCCAEPCKRLVDGFLLTGKIQIFGFAAILGLGNAKHPRIIQIRWEGLSVI